MVKKKRFQPKKKLSVISYQLSDPSKRKEESLPRWKWVFIGLILPLTFYLLLLTFNLFLADVSYAKGLAYKRKGSYALAAENFRRAVELNPFEPAYHRDLAYVLAKLVEEGLLSKEGPEPLSPPTHLAKEAGEEAATAYRLNPFNSLTLKSILKTYYDLSKYYSSYQDYAEKVGDQLLELSPAEARVYYSVALVYAAGGREEEALELTKRALELKPDFSEAKELKALLANRPKQGKQGLSP